MVMVQPRRVQAMVLRRRAEIPDVGIAVAGQQRVPCELVARPFADDRARDIADVVLVETEQRAQTGACEDGAGARQPIVMQPAEIDALLEIDLGVARRLQRTIPAVMWIDVVGADELGFLDLSLRHRAIPVRCLACVTPGAPSSGLRRWLTVSRMLSRNNRGRRISSDR